MKLSEHVDKLRTQIESAFDKEFSRLGFGAKTQIDESKLPEELKQKRERFLAMLDSHIAETGDYVSGRSKLIDELTFTLFNRLSAIKVMEAHNLMPPILTKEAEHGGRSFGHKAWLELRPAMRNEELEGLREYLKYAFDELGKSLPLYNREYPYALLPNAINLNEIIDAFNLLEKDTQVEINIWTSDDVLGWLYESYNNKKKQEHKDSGDKTEYHKVSLQSQVYTPRWVVQFLVENSLGKLYLEMYPTSNIRNKYKIANPPKEVEREIKPLHEIKLIDPACGSGNFLLYAFDFFYDLYLDQIENFGADYNEKEIPKLIIENNLHGVDLDDRAIQIAQLGLYIKAKKKRSSDVLNFKVVSSDFYLPDYEDVSHIFKFNSTLSAGQIDLIKSVWKDLQLAYKFGSLIRLKEQVNVKLSQLINKREYGQQSLIPEEATGVKSKPIQMEMLVEHDIKQEKDFVNEFFNNLEKAVAQYAKTEDNTFLSSKTHDAITFLDIIIKEYDVATTNPPYTDSANFGPELKIFVEENYKKPYNFHTNLYATFIKVCDNLLNEHGKVAMVHPLTFMYIKTFEDVREYILNKYHINVLVEAGMGGVFPQHIFVDPVFYVLDKGKKLNPSLFISLNQYSNTFKQNQKREIMFKAVSDYIDSIQNEHNYPIIQEKLKVIKSTPFIYYISDEFRDTFKNKSVKDLLKNCQGLATANNNRFLRFWWELFANKQQSISEDWAGNLWLMVNWKNNGHEIKNFIDETGKQKSRTQNESVYFKEGITYTASGGKGPSYRKLPLGSMFDVGGSSIFPINIYKNNYYILAFFNSPFSKYIIECLNPTVNKQVGDVERVPFVIPPQDIDDNVTFLSKMNVSIIDYLNTFYIQENSYQRSPFYAGFNLDWGKNAFEFLNKENHLLTQVLINEAIINENIFVVYNLTERDKVMVLAKEGERIGGLPVLEEALNFFLAEKESTKEFPLDSILEYIKSLPIKEFSDEEVKKITDGFPSLYQNNNDLEEFCIRHQVNPINVWYWFKQNNFIPQQRMHTMAMGFLADMIREILMEDDDGIIPLVPNAGEKILLDRIEEKFISKGFSLAQYSSFDSVLGRPMHEYLNKYFFAELSDYLNMFRELPKTPFIWHLSSGPLQGFDCYIIIYKWSRDKLMRLRSVYIEHRERSLVNRQSDLTNNDTAQAQNEKDKIFKQLKEIEDFKQKIDELLAEGYNPILDDGVGKNIAPLQKKGMIPYEVLNAGQLKKYLNADW